MITKEKIRSVNKTNMTELVEEEYQRFPDDAELQAEYKIQKPILADRMKKSFELIDNESAEVKLATNFFAQKDLINELIAKNSLTLENISTKYQITTDILDAYYKFAKFKYECGMYKEVEEMIANYLSVQQPISTISYIGALWARLACHILLAKWSDTVSDLHAVKEAIDVRNATSNINQLNQRGWLMHWCLFLLLSQRDGIETLVDLYSEKPYLQAIENLCPWLLRYYTASIILSPSRRRTNLRDLLKEIKLISYQYTDPMIQFLDCLFDQFDFDEAQIKLHECQLLVKNDFFLQKFSDKFMNESRMLICEMYCTINHNVDINMLSTKLSLTNEEAERWMVSIVRNSTTGPIMNAKIDSANNKMLMKTPENTAYKSVMDTTRDLTTRSSILASNMENLIKEQNEYIKQNLAR